MPPSHMWRALDEHPLLGTESLVPKDEGAALETCQPLPEPAFACRTHALPTLVPRGRHGRHGCAVGVVKVR